jgi:hypothetical protein
VIWRRGAVPALGLIALVFVFLGERWLWPAPAPGANSFDLRFQYFPLYEISFGALAEGRLPVWNPFHLTGLPWLATLQAGFFYPPHAVYLLLPTGAALAVIHAVHLALIAVTTALFARRMGLAPAAAVLAAVLFTLCGTLQWWLFWPNMLEAAAWLPLGCLAVQGIARGEGRRPVALLALATGMSLLAGHTQVTVFLLYTWATLLFALRVAAAGILGFGAPVAWFALALLVGLVVSGIQTLPTFEFTREGTRAAGGLTREAARSVGAPRLELVHQAIAGTRLSFGAVALALAPAALWVRSQRRLAVWALGLGGVSAALALGSGTAWMDLYLAIPGIGWFRQPHRLLFLSQFCAAMACGVTLDGLLRREIGPLIPAVLAGALAAGAAIQGAAGAAGAAAAVAVGVALWWATPRLPSAWPAGALLAVAALDLMVSLPLREPLPYAASWAAGIRRDVDWYRRLAELAGPDRVAWALWRDPGTKLAQRYGLRRIDGFEAFSFRRQEEYFRYLQYGATEPPRAGVFFSGGVLLPADPARAPLATWYDDMAGRRRLLDLAAARWFSVPKRLRFDEAEAARRFVERAGLEPSDVADGRFVLYENPRSLPRAFVTYRALPAPPTAELLRRLADPDFDPLVQSYVEGDPGIAAGDATTPRGSPVTITRDEETAVEVQADLVAPGLLVLSDAYGGGWRARVDGEETPLLPANHLYRGVRVPQGSHRVSFEYQAPGLAAGAGSSLIGLLALAWLARPVARPTA